jgi:predicted nucleic-acid-binding protein
VIGLDTNVLVRFLVEDDPEQARRAKAVVQGAVDQDEKLYVSNVVLCELAWVLDRAYGLERTEVASAVRGLLSAKHVLLEDADLVERALAAYGESRVGFPDYVIRELARDAGCRTVVTFDRTLLREPGFERP